MDQPNRKALLKSCHEAAKAHLAATTEELLQLRRQYDRIREIKLRFLEDFAEGKDVSLNDAVLAVCGENLLLQALRNKGAKWDEEHAEVTHLLSERIKAEKSN